VKEQELAKKNQPYPAEFRQQIIELVRSGRKLSQLSREFGLSVQTIRNWVGQEAVDAGRAPPGKEGALTTAEREELGRLRRKLRQVEQERDILVKATAWFAAKHDKTFTPSTDS
jgi:transposase